MTTLRQRIRLLLHGAVIASVPRPFVRPSATEVVPGMQDRRTITDRRTSSLAYNSPHVPRHVWHTFTPQQWLRKAKCDLADAHGNGDVSALNLLTAVEELHRWAHLTYGDEAQQTLLDGYLTADTPCQQQED